MQVNTRQRILSTIFTLIVLLIGTFLYQHYANRKESTIKTVERKDIRTVTTASYVPETINYRVDIDGRLKSMDQVNFSAEVTGRLLTTNKRFKEGVFYEKGEKIFSIDDTDARYNLLALRSSLLTSITQMMPDLKFDYPQAFEQWKAYLDNFDVEDIIDPLPVIDDQQVKYYVAGKNILNQFYTIKAQENKLSDYSIYAPFNGVVTTANVSPGSLVSPGTILGTFINTSSYELAAPIQLSEMKYISLGQSVQLASSDLDQEWTGRVSRIGKLIDPTTQNLPIFISVSGSGLSEGMYLNGSIKGKSMEGVTGVPEELIVDQNKLFVVQDSTARKVTIQVVNKGDGVAYIRGLSPGLEVISSTVNGIFDGQRVVVKNAKS
jgi:multidrug efflux pump subunit AcrA (membrane-fusion protein)